MSSFNYIYLHGFASGPKSKKAVYFAKRLSESGITTTIPDLNTPSFREMTLTSQVDHVGSIIDEKKNCVVIGSSMGGLVATLTATRFPSVRALILLAPGFGIEKRWIELVEPALRAVWQRDGALEVFHYSTERNEELSYRFVEDLESYSTRNINVSIPTLILHGSRDEVVPVSESKNFANRNSKHAKLIELDDTHELIESLPSIWNESHDFLTSNSLLS